MMIRDFVKVLLAFSLVPDNEMLYHLCCPRYKLSGTEAVWKLFFEKSRLDLLTQVIVSFSTLLLFTVFRLANYHDGPLP